MNSNQISADFEESLSNLSNKTRNELSALWIKKVGHPPPKGCSRGLLELAEAYAIQTSAFGSLKSRLSRRLCSIAPTPSKVKSRPLMQGSTLVREWNGKTHHVEVVQGGFVWNGNNHKSLSAIAKEITGAHWSGPRFFGL
jgi:hypothetical protein